MSHKVDAAQGDKTRAVEVVRMRKTVVHIPPGAGTSSMWVMGELLTYKIPSQRTGGAYALFEVATRPGAGPPPHIHHREDESFYVVAGEYEFLSGEKVLRAGAGSLIYVPKGTLHSHKNVGEGLGKMLVVQTPGGLYEGFFEKVGKPAGGEEGSIAFEDGPEVRRIVKTAAEYGIEIPLPIAQRSRA